LNPHNPEYYKYRAMVYENLGFFELARSDFVKIKELDKNF
jgi:Flp pilus assembly protein TadD